MISDTKYSLYREEINLTTDGWSNFDPNNDDDKEVIKFGEIGHPLMRVKPRPEDFTKVVEWPACRNDADKVIIDFAFSGKFSDNELYAKEFNEYQKLYFVLAKDGYLKFYSREKLDCNITIIAFMQIFDK